MSGDKMVLTPDVMMLPMNWTKYEFYRRSVEAWMGKKAGRKFAREHNKNLRKSRAI